MVVGQGSHKQETLSVTRNMVVYEGWSFDRGSTVAILRHTAGPEVQEIDQTLVYANDDERKDYNAVLGKLRAYCEPRKNVVFERQRFWSSDQLENETVGQWTTELRTRAANCEFHESDNMTRDKIVFGIRDRPVQEKLLREYNLTLEKACF